jgi:hypothetical protein
VGRGGEVVEEMEGGEEDKEVTLLPGVVGLADAGAREVAERHAEERQAQGAHVEDERGVRGYGGKLPCFSGDRRGAKNQSRRSQMRILGRHVNFSTRGLDSARHGVLGRFHIVPRFARPK